MEIDGIGHVTANNIVSERTTPYKSFTDIKDRVNGIGPAYIKLLKKRTYVGYRSDSCCGDKSDTTSYLLTLNVKQLKQLQSMLDINHVKMKKDKNSLIENIIDNGIEISKIKKLRNDVSDKKYMYSCYGKSLKNSEHIFFRASKISLTNDKGTCSRCGKNSLIFESDNEFYN